MIHGRVQGVGYRFFARERASELGITGYARNLPSGDVEVVAEGDEDALITYLEMLREGPDWASVSSVDVSWEPPLGEEGCFRVKA